MTALYWITVITYALAVIVTAAAFINLWLKGKPVAQEWGEGRNA